MLKIFEKLKPAVAKRTLLLIAGCAWSIAGGILISRALVQLITIHHHLLLDLFIGLILGMVFYFLLFARISGKHIYRITMIKIDNPCFFSFFNFRSYFLMAVMITGGITVRKLEIVNKEVLYTFLLTMGIPLLISAYRFFYSWVKNKKLA
jgi:hypothetical protein